MKNPETVHPHQKLCEHTIIEHIKQDFQNCSYPIEKLNAAL